MPWRGIPRPCFRWRRRTRCRSTLNARTASAQVSVLSGKTPYGVALTEKEKTVLRFAGKISKEQLEAAETKDIPPPWRLACQFIVRNEDILVTF
jgi:hypothetical protein